MSEEEIKEIIKDFMELKEIHSNNSLSKSYLTIYQEAVQGLLDLYKKEKEKNQELLDKKIDSSEMLQAVYVKGVTDTEEDFEDKIKEIINKYENVKILEIRDFFEWKMERL